MQFKQGQKVVNGREEIGVVITTNDSLNKSYPLVVRFGIGTGNEQDISFAANGQYFLEWSDLENDVIPYVDYHEMALKLIEDPSTDIQALALALITKMSNKDLGDVLGDRTK